MNPRTAVALCVAGLAGCLSIGSDDENPFATGTGGDGGSGDATSASSADGAGGGSAAGSGGDATTGDGGAGGMMARPNCDPAEGPLDAACDGVYLRPGAIDDQADGSQAHPYSNWATAVEKAGTSGAPLWVCDGQEDVTAEVVLSAPLTIHGGLDCETWAEDDTREGSRIRGALSGLIPLRIQPGATGSVVKRVKVTAKDADNAVAGQSSIAVIVEQAGVIFDGCELAAGQGAQGAPGGVPLVLMGSLDGLPGFDGTNAALGSCASQVQSPSLNNAGGAMAVGLCGNSETSGAAGGNSSASYDSALGSEAIAAHPGDDAPGSVPPHGSGGLGESSSNGTDCKSGSSGAPGSPGGPGQPAPIPGVLDASGYGNEPGGEGLRGTFGLGGGGGGASEGRTCPLAMLTGHIAGTGGGGGGAGACGGPGGGGGGAAGSSFALVSLNAAAKLVATSLASGVGGDGGWGAAGAQGGLGGTGGQGGINQSSSSIKTGCPGGDGGNGGNGGPGAGGNGGHSAGIAFIGTPPLLDLASSIQTGRPGGAGTSLGVGGLSGFPGSVCQTLMFPAGVCL